jgi:tight adherence protein C
LEETPVWTFMAAVGIAAVALLWAGIAATTAMLSPVRRRLKALREDARPLAVTGDASGLSRLWKVFEPSKESERAGVKLRLIQAGLRHPAAVGVFYGIKLLSAALLPVVVFSVLPFFPNVKLPFIGSIAVGLGAVFIGSLVPDMFVSRLFEARKERLMEGLPDALDLLVTCTEAGLGLNAALERVVEQLPSSHPDLAVELGQVNAEVRAGVDRSTALRNLGERTGLEEINGLVSLITHSSRLGTGIAGTLRIYAEDFRDRRMQRAEELAATVGTKLMFPLLLCLFPAFFVVSVGPAILGVMRALAEK